VGNINRLVYEASSSNRYATFFYGQYSPVEGRFDYVNAGHNAPMLFHRSSSDDTLVRLEPGGTVVGLLEDAVYVQGSVRLRPGMNLDDEEWGEERLLEAIQTGRGDSAQELLKHLFEAATLFAGAAPQHDDMTLVVLRAFEA
jgi:sigma-B regulation protein RsbU (phosphoserine phosphatase)